MTKTSEERCLLSEIPNLQFDSVDIPELWAGTETPSAYRLTGADLTAMPDGKDVDGLRRELASLFMQHFKSYIGLETACGIKADTFQKVLRFKGGRQVTYQLLSKFCIGAGLSSQKAAELFAMMGHTLSRKNRADYILLCELDNGGDVTEYDEDLKKFGYPGVLSKPD